MKRFANPVFILLNVCLTVCIVCLTYAAYVSEARDTANANLVKYAYLGDEDRYDKSRNMGANPNTYFDAATKKAVPTESVLSGWMMQMRGQRPAIVPDSAPVLSLAITYGRSALVEDLLTRGADVNAPDDKGSTPLHYAALHNQRDILITLLDHRADINRQNGAGDTALHLAVAQHNVISAQILLDRGADANPVNQAGQTPLDSIGFMAEDQHREWILRYGESKLPSPHPTLPKEPAQQVTQDYKRRLDSLRPLIVALQRKGAKMSRETSDRLTGSFDLNPREIEQALTAPAPATKRGPTAH